jgi:hypothetical protein
MSSLVDISTIYILNPRILWEYLHFYSCRESHMSGLLHSLYGGLPLHHPQGHIWQLYEPNHIIQNVLYLDNRSCFQRKHGTYNVNIEVALERSAAHFFL